jgi:hypothetical protein
LMHGATLQTSMQRALKWCLRCATPQHNLCLGNMDRNMRLCRTGVSEQSMHTLLNMYWRTAADIVCGCQVCQPHHSCCCRCHCVVCFVSSSIALAALQSPAICACAKPLLLSIDQQLSVLLPHRRRRTRCPKASLRKSTLKASCS